MSKKVIFLFTLLILIGCMLGYKFGSAPVAHAQSLPASPATWSLTNSYDGATGQVSVTQPAVSGAQHVVTCITAFMSAGTAAQTTNVFLINGSATGTDYLLHWNMQAPAGSSSTVNLCGLNLVGTADTPMTLEIADGTDISVNINLVGYDAQ
jgi:hypothetical protein